MAVTIGADGGPETPPPGADLEAACSRWTRTVGHIGGQPTSYACHAANAGTCTDGGPNYCFFADNEAGPNSVATTSCQVYAASDAYHMSNDPFCCCG